MKLSAGFAAGASRNDWRLSVPEGWSLAGAGTRLCREVAVRMLPSEVSFDADGLTRSLGKSLNALQVSTLKPLKS